jgi:hypothetical protein
MIRYYDLGPDKQLNEIVMAGSHDAGITAGGSNVQTQNLDIGGQALAGVRLFDLRIAAAADGKQGGTKQATLKAFHADSKLMSNEKKSRYVAELGRTEQITRTKLRGGAFGEGLAGMLQQARAFVEKYDSEFLILKFDKCKNWGAIAEVCVSELGPVLYTGSGNLNTRSLRDLKKKVICLFTDAGLAEAPAQYKWGKGILGIRNLYNGGGYFPSYDGMQYFGKGGTSPFSPFKKISQNEKKQEKLLKGGAAAGNPEVMGMMYWTTTGLNESIQTRNDSMWTPKGVGKLETLWRAGLDESISTRIGKHIDPTSYASAPVLKAFMPNFIMIDFADDMKCQQIYDLNAIAAVELTYAARQVDLAVQQARRQYGQLQAMGRA